MAADQNRYAAFISYRHMPRDREWAIRIMRELETYRTPKALRAEAFPERVGHLFRDEDEIPASSDLSDQIKDALKRSDHLIVVCSPDTPGSRWVRREIELFQEMGKGERVIPLLIAGEPEESFPPELRRRRIERRHDDGSVEFDWEEVEPIAADVRPRKDERKSATERRALLRLASALLGCRFDDLARRDEERRKAALRRNIGAAAAVLAVAAMGGASYWDRNYRIHTFYCVNYAERWAVPECVGRLTDEQQHRRSASYRFRTQANYVLEMARVSGSRNLIDVDSEYAEDPLGKGAALWKYEYLTNARGVRPNLGAVQIEGANGANLRTISYKFSDDGREAVAAFDRGLGVAERQSASGNTLGLATPYFGFLAPHTEIGQHRLLFDAQGHIARRTFEPVGGGFPIKDASGSYGAIYSYGVNGIAETVQNADANGTPQVTASGFATQSRRYKFTGELVKVEWLDPSGKLHNNEQWFAVVELIRNKNGNITIERFLGEDGSPSIRKDKGVAIRKYEYDIIGNNVMFENFNIKDQTVLDADGVAGYFVGHDTNGRATEARFFGVDHKPITGKLGAIERFRYDSHGNCIEFSFFDSSGLPTLNEDGYARRVDVFDDKGRHLEQRYFGIDGKPTFNRKDHIARRSIKYDDAANSEEERFYDTEERHTLNKYGVAGWTFRYDRRGNRIDETYFGENNEPMLNNEGIAGARHTYDERGNFIKNEYYGLLGEPIAPNGIAWQTSAYNDKGLAEEFAHFGLDGKPAANTEGYAKRAFRYDDRGNVAVIVNYGVDGTVIQIPEGWARRSALYDDLGRQTELVNYDVAGKLIAAGEIKVARVKFHHDKYGNADEISYFGADGKPQVSNQGFARMVRNFDGRGNVLDEAYFGVDGNPILRELGYARMTSQFDDNGRRTETRFFGVDRNPTLGIDGTAGARMCYDTHGRMVEESVFDFNEKPALNRNGYSKKTNGFDARGNQIDEAYFGVADEPINSADGYASTHGVYDERDQLIEQKFYGVNGRLAPSRDGFARMTIKYDARGNAIELSYFGVDGRPAAGKGGAARLVAEYNAAGKATKFFRFDANGDRLPQSMPDEQRSIAKKGEVEIEDILPNSTAEKVGLAPGDRLLSYNGERLSSVQQLVDLTRKPGENLRKLVYRRGKKTLSTDVAPGRLGVQIKNVRASDPPGATPAPSTATPTKH